MQTKLDEAKAELLAEAARVAENSPAGGHLPARGLEQGGVPTRTPARVPPALLPAHRPEDLTDRDPVDVFGAAFSHYRLAENRPQGTANVRVHTPTVEENGWTCSHSVVEVVTDDMPFLVDSVTNELSRQGRGIHVVIHPQIDRAPRRHRQAARGAGRRRDAIPAPARPSRSASCRTTRSPSPGSMSRSTARPTAPTSSRSPPTCCASCPTCARPSRTGRRCATPRCASPTSCPSRAHRRRPARPGGRGGARAAALARRRPLHLPRLPRVRAAAERTTRCAAVAGTGLGILRSDPQHSRGRRPPRQPVLQPAARRRPRQGP